MGRSKVVAGVLLVSLGVVLMCGADTDTETYKKQIEENSKQRMALMNAPQPATELGRMEKNARMLELQMQAYWLHYDHAMYLYHDLYKKGVKPNSPEMRSLQETKTANLKNYKHYKARYEEAKQGLEKARAKRR